MNKPRWQRAYRLEIGDGDEAVVFDGTQPAANGRAPANIAFNVSVSADRASTVAIITVFGIGRGNPGSSSTGTMERIYQTYDRVKLDAGWVGDIATIFQGTLYNVSVGRQGPESFIELQCRSTGVEWQEAFLNKSWATGTPAQTLIREAAETFGYPVQFIGNFDDLPPLTLGMSKSVNTKLYMDRLAKNYAFSYTIFNGKTIITRLGATNDAPDSIHYISRNTGMKGTPIIKERGLDVVTTILPQAAPYDRFIVENVTAENTFNSPYARRYRGTIGAGEYEARQIQHIGEFEGQAWDTILLGWGFRDGDEVPRTGQ